MSRKNLLLLVPAIALLGCSSDAVTPKVPSELPVQASRSARGGPTHTLGTVYVSSQGLYYDTFATVENLPHHGRFQLLVGGVTEFGPGQPGYLGGRWWVDDGDGVQEDNGDDAYVLCPLLPPGRTTP